MTVAYATCRFENPYNHKKKGFIFNINFNKLVNISKNIYLTNIPQEVCFLNILLIHVHMSLRHITRLFLISYNYLKLD